jgi:predicted TIM-barrel fold metal-dependent hydrolase
MQLPDDSPVEIIDAFCQLHLGDEVSDVPIAREALRDDASLDAWPSTGIVSHLFRKDPEFADRDAMASDIDRWIANLDAHRIARAQVPLTADTPNEVFDQIAEHTDRIFVAIRANPHEGVRGYRRIQDLATRYPFVRSVSLSPHMLWPATPPNAKECYPLWDRCSELGLTAFVNVGFPGPKVPAATQDPMHLDEVCWFFPDLRVVMRHGGEPWADVCVKLMEKWPNLYYATTAFTPRRYPQEIIDFVNRRGADKIVFAGYWPILSYEKIFGELSELAIKDEVWPKLLAGNAVRAFGL